MPELLAGSTLSKSSAVKTIKGKQELARLFSVVLIDQSIVCWSSSMKLTFGWGGFTGFEGSVLERKSELLRLEGRESLGDHLCVGEDDAVHAQTGSLDWVLVHFDFYFLFINNYNFIFIKQACEKKKRTRTAKKAIDLRTNNHTFYVSVCKTS